MKRILPPFLLVPALIVGSAASASAQAPANDGFANRSPVSGALPIRVPGSCEGAGAEAGEPDHATATAGNLASNSVWYRWVASVTGSVSFSAQSEEFDMVVGVYTGATLGALVPAGYADNFEIGAETAVARVQSGENYLIAVDGYSNQRGSVFESGEFELVIDALARPANDDFANPAVMPSSLVTARTATTLA